MEDKKAICAALLKALKLTRCGEDLESLEYKKNEYMETVIVTYKKPYNNEMNIDVTADSGVSMIRDIMWSIDR